MTRLSHILLELFYKILWEWFYWYDNIAFTYTMRMISQDIIRMILLIWWQCFHGHYENDFKKYYDNDFADFMTMISQILWQLFYRYYENDFTNMMTLVSQILWEWFHRYFENDFTDIMRMISQILS